MMLDMSYDPAIGKYRDFNWNWLDYFGGEELVETPTRIWATDRATGMDGRYPLIPGDGTAFNKAAIGDGFYTVGRTHLYIHRQVEAL